MQDSNCTSSISNLTKTSRLESRQFNAVLAITLNSSCNGNSSSIKNPYPEKTTNDDYDYFTIILLAMMASILFIGAAGNSVVCYVFGFKQRKTRSVPETLFLYLGAIDLTSSIINPSLYIYWTITRYSRWDFGIVGCKLLASLAPISVTLSALIILIIAVDRYFVICGQFGRRYSRNRIHCAVILAAIFAICLFIPYIIRLQVDDYHPCLVRSIDDPVYAYSTTVALLLQDVGFIGVLSFTNYKSFSRLHRKGTAMMEQSLERRRLRSNKRVAKILLAMSCVFCLLVLPRDIMQLAYIISWLNPPGLNFTRTLKNTNALFKVLQTANSCVNVFIYSKMHTKFRGHVRNLCLATCSKKQLIAESAVMTMASITPKLRKRVLKFNVENETPSATPELKRKGIKHGSNLDELEASNSLLIGIPQRNSRVKAEPDATYVNL